MFSDYIVNTHTLELYSSYTWGVWFHNPSNRNVSEMDSFLFPYPFLSLFDLLFAYKFEMKEKKN